ncbi:MAG: PEP-CTERM sorting domain-containing protein [Verrucomicrobiota bacterium]
MKNMFKFGLFALTVAATVVMGNAQIVNDGDLIASLHMDNAETDQTNVDTADNLTARGAGASGAANTTGVLTGTFDFLAANTVGEADINAFTNNTVLRDLNRFGSATNGGSIVAWDYNFSGITNNAGGYTFKIDYTAEGGKSPSPMGFYLSYNNGGGLSLDTTDLASATPNANTLVINNTANYESILSLDTDQTAETLTVDITSQINAAIANGGGVRIAFVDGTFRNTINILNDSGIVATVPEPSSFALLALGLGALVCARRRK